MYIDFYVLAVFSIKSIPHDVFPTRNLTPCQGQFETFHINLCVGYILRTRIYLYKANDRVLRSKGAFFVFNTWATIKEIMMSMTVYLSIK